MLEALLMKKFLMSLAHSRTPAKTKQTILPVERNPWYWKVAVEAVYKGAGAAVEICLWDQELRKDVSGLEIFSYEIEASEEERKMRSSNNTSQTPGKTDSNRRGLKRKT